MRTHVWFNLRTALSLVLFIMIVHVRFDCWTETNPPCMTDELIQTVRTDENMNRDT